jgi:hypothetical protein
MLIEAKIMIEWEYQRGITMDCLPGLLIKSCTPGNKK